ncbi:hypothetical protein EDC21_102218 [Thermohydrogenium kirishiense]|nr:hypothetical protein EDC21_102218 [Thermohydrogenium kirishiense]
MKKYREFILNAFILISIILAVFIMFVILDITVVKIYTG